jgi:lipopolysaccharide cholinephosphotransferase
MIHNPTFEYFGFQENNLTLTRPEAQEFLIAAFSRLVKLLDENEITYFLAFGTLLGAVRQQTIIPWDDDIDIFVYEKDLNRLRLLITSEMADICEYSTPDHPSKVVLPPIKLMLRGVYGEESKLSYFGVPSIAHPNLSIDVFPIASIEKVPSPFILRFLNIIKRIWINNQIISKAVYQESKIGVLEWNFRKLLMLIPEKVLTHAYFAFQSFADSTNFPLLGFRGPTVSSNDYFLAEHFRSSANVSLNGLEVRAPIGFCDLLVSWYGVSYLVEPDPDARISHCSKYSIDRKSPFCKKK